MRRSRNLPLFLALCGLLALPACSGGKPGKDEATGKAGNAAAPPGNAAAANETAPGPGPQSLSEDSEGYEFSYKWPAAASAIPELNAWLNGNGERLLAQTKAAALSEKVEAKKEGYPFHGHSYEEDFGVNANTPRMLVLLSNGYVFTGGAHGMPINTAIIWDKGTKKRLATAALIDLPRFADLAKKRFCDELDKQRAEKRGEPVKHDDPNELDDFVRCVDMTKQLILPVSKGGKALDMVKIVIAPYEAGPYAEGTYEIDLPLDAGLLKAVKAPYREAFAAAS
ncbi:MAG: DUF4163 domain-containing protein [Sphingobium sp.]